MPRPDLSSLARRLPARPLTRFAPSPTGYLHLGHVVNAVYVWGLAGALGGRVLLRIEDHDRRRSREDYARALLEDLDWLGLAPDLGPERQTDRPERYSAALAELARHHTLYACDCSRRLYAAPTGLEARYPGTCRTRGLADRPGHGIRVELAAGIERFDDPLRGEERQDPAAQCGDLLLRDRDGHWTYQFAVTVDDWRDRIDLVIRGVDLLESTGRQIRLAGLLGRGQPPVFLHHPVLLKASGEKLSKSSGDTGVRELRDAGVSAAEVIGRAAHAAGLIHTPAAITASRVAELFE